MSSARLSVVEQEFRRQRTLQFLRSTSEEEVAECLHRLSDDAAWATFECRRLSRIEAQCARLTELLELRTARIRELSEPGEIPQELQRRMDELETYRFTRMLEDAQQAEAAE